MDYGFRIHADEDVIKTMRNIERSMYNMQGTVEHSTQAAERSMERMGNTARSIGKYIAEAFAVREIIHYGEELLHLTAEFESFQNVIKFSSRNSYDAGQNLEFIGDVVKRLHLPLKEAMQGFSEMQAGLIGTGIEGENLRKVFEGIATAGAVLHLPARNLEMILYDFKELGERGLNMKNWMSLSGWFPGIGNVVHETFGKSFHELEAEKMPSGEFLSKLGEGITKHFQSGLPNAGNSLQANMNDTKNAILETFLRMGEELRPVFMDIMKDIQGVFNGGLVKDFVDNLKPMVEIMITLGKAWVLYKVGVIGADFAMKAYAKTMEIVEALQAMQIAQIDAWEIAMLKVSSISTAAWVGALVVGLGWVVDKFIEVNQKAADFIDNLTGIKDVAASLAAMNSKSKNSTAAIGNLMNLTPTEKSELLSDLLSQQKNISKEINMNSAAKTKQAGVDLLTYPEPTQLKGESDIAFSGRLERFWSDKNRITDNIKSMEGMVTQEKKTQTLVNQQIQYLQNMGIKPFHQVMPENENIKKGSLHTMGLAGAKGGLGEAKNIAIHIGTMQRVDVKTPDAIRTAAGQGMEVLLRVLNNLAYGRSSTM